MVNKTDEELKIDGETKDLKLTPLPNWLSSKSDFNEAIKLINDIRADTNNVKPDFDDKKVLDDLEKLINDIINNQVNKKVLWKEWKKKHIWLRKTKGKRKCCFLK